MDIAKYIGAYLLRNGFCYVHGLGNMKVSKISATHDGANLQAPTWDVEVTPGGSIDDNLANYIATNEQISISKAANALREFSTESRKHLAEGKEVEIPNIGKFTEVKGKIGFVTDKNFSYTPKGIPTIKNSKQLEEQNARPAHKPSYPPPAKADSINWSMVILVVVLVVILAGGGYFVYQYTSNKAEEQAAVETPVIDTPEVQQPPVAATPDSAAMAAVDSAAQAPVVDSTTESKFTFVIGNYHTRERADKRVTSLTLNGNQVAVVDVDSLNHLVITDITCRYMDTTHVKDSLRRMFGFQGVAIYPKQ